MGGVGRPMFSQAKAWPNASAAGMAAGSVHMLNALRSNIFGKMIPLFSLRNSLAVIAVTALMIGGYTYSEAQARGGNKGYSSRGHGGGKPRMRAGHRSKQLNVSGKRTGYNRGYGRYNNRYRSGSVLRHGAGRNGVKHGDRGSHRADRGYRNNRKYVGDQGRSNAGYRNNGRDGYRGGRDYRRTKHHRNNILRPGGKRYGHNIRRYDRYGNRGGYRDYGLRGGYDSYRRHRRGGRDDYYRNIAGGALILSSGGGYQDPYYDSAYADNEPILESDCAEGPYCTIRLGPYLNSPKIITLYSGKGENPVKQLEGDVTVPPVN